MRTLLLLLLIQQITGVGLQAALTETRDAASAAASLEVAGRPGQARRTDRQVVVRCTPETFWTASVMALPRLSRSSASSWTITS